jgi:hypothetical protein
MISIPRISFACVLRALFCSCVLAVLTAQQSAATIFSLTDDNSVAQFDTSTASNNFNWLVNGNDQLAQLAYWYRIGNGAEQSVHLLPIVAQGTSDTNFNGNPDTLFVRYNNGSGLQIETRYSLDGGAAGTGASDMSAQISITNFTASPMDFHFFQYADFDISSGDSAVFTNPNTVQQSGPGGRLVESVVTPVPTHREIAFFPVTLNKLNDGVATTLSDTPAGGTAVGPGDVTWADQWDVVIAPGATFQISTDTNLNAVPEPGVGSLLIVAMVLFSGGRLLQLRTRRATLA